VNASGIINSIVDFFFPNICVVCGSKSDDHNISVCSPCLNKIEYIEQPYCKTCCQPLPDGGAHCWQCQKTKYHFDRVIAAGKYDGVLRQLILKFKEKDLLKTVLGDMLVSLLKKNIDITQFDSVLAVPLARKKEFKRGYNQAQLLTEVVCKKLGKQIIKGKLVRTKNTKPQFELTRDERLVNLNGAFEVKNPLSFENKNVVLIDDIATTCSTLNECSRVLRKAGANKVLCAVLARD